MISTIIQVLPMPSDYGKVHPPSFLLTLLSAYTSCSTVVIKSLKCAEHYCINSFSSYCTTILCIIVTNSFSSSSESLYNTVSNFICENNKSQVIRFFFSSSYLCRQDKALIRNSVTAPFYYCDTQKADFFPNTTVFP